MEPMHSFQIADYVIFVITVVISIAIGIYYAFAGGKQKTTAEYLVGNRRMQVVPVAISLMVSFESSIMMLGIPAEVYEYGTQWIWKLIGFLIANILAIKIMVPLLHPLKITSAYEYLELRFKSRAVRLTGTVLGLLSYTIYIGIVLFGPGVALEAVTGFPQWMSIVIIAAASVIYTSIVSLIRRTRGLSQGGIKAVVWTDVFQAFVMYSGMIAILIKGTIDTGGIVETWTIAQRNGRLNWFNFDPDPTLRHTFWILLFGSLIRGFGLVFNQSTIQRISSTPSLKDAKRVMLITTPAFGLTMFCAGMEGLVAYSYYDKKGCDPLESKRLTNPNQIIPYMVMDIFKRLPGMPGLFLASLFSAALSTLSSGLSSLSALLYTDIIKPHTKPMSQLKATIIAKVAVIVFGCLAVVVAFLVSYVGGNLTQISGTLLAAFGGPLSGLFLLGCFVPFANATGALTAALFSMCFTAWIAAGQYMTKANKRWPTLPSGPLDKCFAFVNITMDAFLTNGTSSPSTGSDTRRYESTTVVTSTEVPPAEGIARLYTISYLWIGTIGVLTVVVVGSLVSLCTGPVKSKDANAMYLISFADELLCYLPSKVRKFLRCNVDYSIKDIFLKESEKLDEYVQKTEEEGIEIKSDVNILISPVNGKPTDANMLVDGHIEENTPLPPATKNLYLESANETTRMINSNGSAFPETIEEDTFDDVVSRDVDDQSQTAHNIHSVSADDHTIDNLEEEHEVQSKSDSKESRIPDLN